MADLALVYSKSALDFVVNKVQTAIEEEEERWLIAQRDLVFITDEFEMMQSFLNTVDGERLKSLVVRTWVQQVRNLSYDVEDSIEFVLQLDFGKRPWWLRLLPYWMKKAPEAPVDEAVAEITQLKARVVDVSKRNRRYNLVTDSGAKPGAFRGIDISHINTNDFPDLNECFNFLDMSLRAICVVSEMVGDLGTLDFIRGLYDTCNFSRRAWVKLMHPFNPHEFIRSLLLQFLRSSCKAEGEKILGVEVLTRMEEIQVMNEFVKQVNKHNNYFIVLEGVSSMEEWEAIKTYLPERRNGSRIIVWTHHIEIATLCTGVPYRAFVIRQSSPHHPSRVFYRVESEAGSKGEEEKAARAWPDEHKKEARMLFRALRDTNIRRVAMWGPPSIGKTMLMKAVYESVQGLDGTDKHRGFAQQAWVNMPPSFTGTNDLAHKILSELTNDTWKGDLVTTCQAVLKHRPGNTLVVLDGVRSKEDWDRIHANVTCAMQPRSCVVVITQDVSVAKHIAPLWQDEVVEVEPLAAVTPVLKHGLKNFAVPSSLYERQVEIDELHNKVVLDRKRHRRLVVWGPPGVGKTELVKAVYDQAVEDDGFMNKAWATVPDPFVNVVGVSRDILSGISSEPVTDAVQHCRSLLEVIGSTLVVLDSVRSKEDWDRINVDLTSALKPGSCVVVITRDESVAAHCVERSDVDHVLRVNPLGAPAAHSLFLKTLHSKRVKDDELKECRSLLSKCGGLPKFIATIAGYLTEISEAQRVKEMRHLNDNFIHQLQNNPKLDSLKYVLAWLHSKFDGSPTVLKKCIFYLSLFPRDRNIRWKRLVRRWVAEGYCSGTNSMEEAENLIGKVSDLCLFQAWETVTPVPGAMSKTTCRVNSSFLDYIISRQTEERTFLPLEISVLEGRCSLPTNRVGQHLAIRKCWGRDKVAYINLDFSHLRSLTASGKWKPFFISQKMRVLRVLDLEDTEGLQDGDLKKILKLVPRLKFLSLRRCKTISRLPDSLGKLSLLETLDVKDTDINELPKTITKLQKLQHIRAGKTQCGSGDAETPAEQPEEQRRRQSTGSKLSDCLTKSFGGRAAGDHTGGVRVPLGMGGMKALHTLGVVDVDMPGGKDLLSELRKKKKKQNKKKEKKSAEPHPLRNLSLCGLNWSHHLLRCISSQDQLESLSLRAEKLQVEHFSLPPNLVKFSLDVAGILYQAAVDAIKDHPKLQTLRLHAENVETDTVRFFKEMEDGESGGGSFREVQILEISCSSCLHVMFSQQGMRKLELLKVHCRSGSPSEISGLEQLGALKQVWLIGSCDDTLKEALERQIPKEKINLL